MPEFTYLGRSDTVTLADGRRVSKGGRITLSAAIVERLTASGHRFEAVAPPPKPAKAAETERQKRTARASRGPDSALSNLGAWNA